MKKHFILFIILLNNFNFSMANEFEDNVIAEIIELSKIQSPYVNINNIYKEFSDVFNLINNLTPALEAINESIKNEVYFVSLSILEQAISDIKNLNIKFNFSGNIELIEEKDLDLLIKNNPRYFFKILTKKFYHYITGSALLNYSNVGNALTLSVSGATAGSALSISSTTTTSAVKITQTDAKALEVIGGTGASAVTITAGSGQNALDVTGATTVSGDFKSGLKNYLIARKTAAQTNVGDNTDITFGSEVDPLTQFASPTFTASVAGKYYVSATVQILYNSGVARRVGVKLVNSAGTLQDPLESLDYIQADATNGYVTANISGIVSLASSGTLKLQVNDPAGGTVDIQKAILSVYLISTDAS